jgi:glycosyltransferase involved in cell wall biosynthesis
MIINPAISVVIPVYNGELYIKKTLESLRSQTFSNYEIICVNDGSTDNSLNILESLALIDSRIKIFSKPNEGAATQAVIYGLRHAIGQYFMYSSQDDIFSADLLEKNYNRAKLCNADAVIPDLKYYSEDNNLLNSPGIYGIKGDRKRELTGLQAFVLSLDWTIHGFVLWNIDIVRKVGFYTYGLSSDEYSTRLFFFNSKKVVFSDGIFYYRQDNPEAITKKWNIKQLDYIETCRRLESFLIKNRFSSNEISIIRKIMLNELIRIYMLFLNNNTKLKPVEYSIAKKLIKKTYLENCDKFKSIKFAGGFSKTLISQNIIFFYFLCKVAHIRQSLIKGASKK